MKILTLFGSSIGISLLLALSIFFKIIESSLLRVRYKVIDKEELAKLFSNKTTKKLLKKNSCLPAFLRFSYIATTLLIGFFIYPFSMEFKQWEHLEGHGLSCAMLAFGVYIVILSVQFLTSELVVVWANKVVYAFLLGNKGVGS